VALRGAEDRGEGAGKIVAIPLLPITLLRAFSSLLVFPSGPEIVVLAL
jgi:hypothetical protein